MPRWKRSILTNGYPRPYFLAPTIIQTHNSGYQGGKFGWTRDMKAMCGNRSILNRLSRIQVNYPFDEHLDQNPAAELEHQELVKRCHCLVAALANRPGSTKLLKGVIPTLEIFANYKANRTFNR